VTPGTPPSLDTLTERLKHVGEGVEQIRQDLRDLRDHLEARYVTHDQFWPVARVVYGLVALVGVAVGGAVLALIGLKR
jgi:hypothetical protein